MRIYFESYLPMSFSYMLYLQEGYETGSTIETVASVFSIVQAVSLVLVPIAIFLYLRKS